MKRFKLLICAVIAAAMLGTVACSKPDNGGNQGTPLSSDTGLTVASVCGVAVESNAVTLTTAQYEELLEADDKASKAVYTLADKASVEVTLTDKTLKFAVTAEDGTKKDYEISLTVEPEIVLSSNTGLTVASVCGVVVESNAVTLTTAQYEELLGADDKASKAVYTLADKASVEVSLTDKTLKFAVTAEDGTKKDYEVTLTVLSDEASVTVYKLLGNDVANGMVTATQNELIELKNASNALELIEYESADKSIVTASYNASTHTVTVTSAAEDGSAEKSVSVLVNVIMPFGQHSRTDYGSVSNVSYDYNENLYCIKGNAMLKDGEQNLSNVWAFSADFMLPELGTKELRLISSTMETAFIRYVVRGHEDGTVELFTDYKDQSDSYRGYKVHLNNVANANGTVFSLGLINVGDSVIMTYDGEILYRMTLPTQFKPEMMIYSDSNAYFKNMQIVTDVEKVRAAYDKALEGYEEVTFGKTLLNTGSNVDKATVNDDGSITINSLGKLESSGGRVMGAVYSEGVPISGYRYAVSGRLEITNTKRTGSAASKVELQIAKNTSNYIKLYIFRFPTNNSLYYQCTDNGVNEAGSKPIKSKCFTDCEGTDLYVLDYVIAYNLGKIEFWVKEISAGASTLKIAEWTKLYERKTEWGFTNFCIGNTQYCDVTFRNTQPHYNQDYDAFMSSFADGEVSVTVEGAFTAKENGTYIKTDYSYASEPVLVDGDALKGDYWVAEAGVVMPEHNAWAQAELVVEKDPTHAVRYVFEYVKGGSYQVFTEYKNGHENWQGWRAVVSPSTKNPYAVRLSVVNNGGTVSALVDGYLYHTYTDMNLNGAALKVGGKAGVVKLFDLGAITDTEQVKQFASEMKEYSYVSPYENAIRTRESTYKNAPQGGVLFFGSSTMDYWETYATDCGLVDGQNAYNVGIGGTIVEDWTYAYDRLITPFNPSKVVIFLGGNNVTAKGQTGEETVEKLAELLEKIHADFPSAPIYYIYSMPCPGYCVNGVYKGEYGDLVYGMHKYIENNSSWVTGIDMHDVLTDENGNALDGVFKSDNIHLTDYGYTLWTSVLKPIVFND